MVTAVEVNVTVDAQLGHGRQVCMQDGVGKDVCTDLDLTVRDGEINIPRRLYLRIIRECY